MDHGELLHGPTLLTRARAVLAVPMNVLLEVELLDADDPAAGVTSRIGPAALNGAGGAHASAVSAVLETAALLALLPHLTTTEHAVTHTVTVSLLAAVPAGARVEARGEVDRRTRRLAFAGATARVDGSLVARAQLVKSVVPLR